MRPGAVETTRAKRAKNFAPRKQSLTQTPDDFNFGFKVTYPSRQKEVAAPERGTMALLEKACVIKPAD
jgi:hypothetical protein